MRRVVATIEKRLDLDAERPDLYRLMDDCYLNMDWDRFAADLTEKDTVIVVRESASGKIVGFTTIMNAVVPSPHKNSLVFFSGDTVIERSYWGSLELPRACLRHMLSTAANFPDHDAYWLLISSGHRTYRFLSVFAREYYPRYDRATPLDVRARMSRFARYKYGTDFLPDLGIVRFQEPTPMRGEFAAIGEHQLRNPHVAFLSRANPGWRDGDELVCIAEASVDNLTTRARHLVQTP